MWPGMYRGLYSWYIEDTYLARYEVSTFVYKIPRFIGMHSVNWYIGTIVSEELTVPIFKLSQEISTCLKIIAQELRIF